MMAEGELFKKLIWMFKVQDCCHICLFCRYYEVCITEEPEKGPWRRMNMRYALKSEDTEQITVIQWAQHNVCRNPELKWLYHCPNGGSRNQREAVKLKQMGVKAGVADLCLPYPKGIYCGLYIEMKYGSNRQQESQKEFLKDMAAAGHFVATCYSAEEAIAVIKEYLDLPHSGKEESVIRDVARFTEDERLRRELATNLMQIPNNSILKDGGIKGGAM